MAVQGSHAIGLLGHPRVAYSATPPPPLKGEVQWIKKQQTQHHPYGWEVRVQVMLAGGGGGGHRR